MNSYDKTIGAFIKLFADSQISKRGRVSFELQRGKKKKKPSIKSEILIKKKNWQC